RKPPPPGSGLRRMRLDLERVMAIGCHVDEQTGRLVNSPLPVRPYVTYSLSPDRAVHTSRMLRHIKVLGFIQENPHLKSRCLELERRLREEGTDLLYARSIPSCRS